MLMVTSSKRAYAKPKSTAPRAPVPTAVHCWPIPPQETLKHSSVSVSVGCLGPGAQIRWVWALWASLKVMGFVSKCSLAPPTILLGLPLCPWMWGISSKSLQWCAAAAPVPCSQHSSAYCLPGAFLSLDMGYLLTVTPALHNCFQCWAADVGYLLPVPPVHCSCPPAPSSRRGVSPHSRSSMVQVKSNAVRAIMHRNLEC